MRIFQKGIKETVMAAEERKAISNYRVIYGDTDQMGVVYYANYLRWFEIGRTELLRQVGMPYTDRKSVV